MMKKTLLISATLLTAVLLTACMGRGYNDDRGYHRGNGGGHGGCNMNSRHGMNGGNGCGGFVDKDKNGVCDYHQDVNKTIDANKTAPVKK